MILGGSGHRVILEEHYNHVYIETEKVIKELKPDKIISGLALGFDQLLAVIGFRNNIPVLGAIPFVGQESRWSERQKIIYQKIIEKCSETVIVSNGDYAVWKLMDRNKYIVDNSNVIISYFSGKPSGTSNCLNYAKSINKQIINIYPND